MHLTWLLDKRGNRVNECTAYRAFYRHHAVEEMLRRRNWTFRPVAGIHTLKEGIATLMNPTRWDKRICRDTLLKTIGVPRRIPLDLQETYYDVVCYTQQKQIVEPCAEIRILVARNVRHRVLIVCSKCNRLIPIGRYHQHWATH